MRYGYIQCFLRMFKLNGNCYNFNIFLNYTADWIDILSFFNNITKFQTLKHVWWIKIPLKNKITTIWTTKIVQVRSNIKVCTYWKYRMESTYVCLDLSPFGIYWITTKTKIFQLFDKFCTHVCQNTSRLLSTRTQPRMMYYHKLCSACITKCALRRADDHVKGKYNKFLNLFDLFLPFWSLIEKVWSTHCIHIQLIM